MLSGSPTTTKEKDQRIVVLAYPTMCEIAQGMCNAHPQHFRMGSIKWGYFPDGWPNIKFEGPELLESRDVVFLGSLYDRRTVLEQVSMVMVLPRQGVKSLSIVFPYFAPATMERVDEEGVLATAETTAKMMSACIPMTRSGPAVFRVFDLHALPVRFYFDDRVTMRTLTATHLLKAVCPASTTIIVFPDEGAGKRFKKAFAEYPVVVCSKVRDGDRRVIKIGDHHNFSGDEKVLSNRDLVIVDDLVQSGRTLHECRVALQNAFSPKTISAFVTHTIFPQDGFRKFAEGGEFAGMTKFYCTNTVPEVAAKLRETPPFHVLDITATLAKDLLTSLH
jgi:phosphoribosylpyrophosphate synthetase